MIRLSSVSRSGKRGGNDLGGDWAGLGRDWSGGRFAGFGHIQAGAEMIGRTFFQPGLRDIAASQQDLAAGRKLNVMRDVQILEHLLHDPLEDRRRNLASLMQTDGRVENHDHCNLRIVDGSKSGKGRDIFRLRVSARGWIHLLCRAGLAAEL